MRASPLPTGSVHTNHHRDREGQVSSGLHGEDGSPPCASFGRDDPSPCGQGRFEPVDEPPRPWASGRLEDLARQVQGPETGT